MKTTHADDLAERPCLRGCVIGPEDAQQAMRARHGNYCARCWGRLDQTLIQAPELAAHILGNVTPGGGAAGERVDSSKEAPLPFNQNAFDDVSELYSLLVYWCNIWADYLEETPPKPAARAWRRDSGTIAGLPANVTPEQGALIIGRMTQWLRDRLDIILTLAPEDVDEFDAAIVDVWRMNARWPRIQRPKFAVAPCPSCGRRIAVYPPTFGPWTDKNGAPQPGDTSRVMCEGDHVFTEDEFKRISRDHAQAAAEQVKGEKVAAHLVKKYLDKIA